LAKERQHGEDLQFANVKLANDKKEIKRSIGNLRADLAQKREKILDTEKALHEIKKMVGDLIRDKKENERRLSLYESYIGGLDNIDIGDL
jgi:hypothetical protein